MNLIYSCGRFGYCHLCRRWISVQLDRIKFDSNGFYLGNSYRVVNRLVALLMSCVLLDLICILMWLFLKFIICC